MLMDVFARKDRRPILIATEGIMKDALANEAALREKADQIINGSLITLKDMVPEADWKRIEKKTCTMINGNVKEKEKENKQLIDGVAPSALKKWFKDENLLVGKMIRFLYNQENKVSFAEFKAGVQYEKSDKMFQDNIDSGRSIGSKYGKLWIMSNGYVNLNPEIKMFLGTLM
jgi:hypothetical protein